MPLELMVEQIHVAARSCPLVAPFPQVGGPSRRCLADVGGGDDREQDLDRYFPLCPFLCVRVRVWVLFSESNSVLLHLCFPFLCVRVRVWVLFSGSLAVDPGVHFFDNG
jgi:hypothetical protein